MFCDNLIYFFMRILGHHRPGPQLNSENELLKPGFNKPQRGLACVADSLICAMALASRRFVVAELLRKIYLDREYKRDWQMVDRPNATPVVSGLLT